MSGLTDAHDHDFDVESSPLVYTQPAPDFPMFATASPLRFTDSDFFQDVHLFDLPLPDLSGFDQMPQIGIEVTNEPPRPKSTNVRKIVKKPVKKAAVFKPFVSVGSIELTVQTLREQLNQRIRRSQSASLPGFSIDI